MLDVYYMKVVNTCTLGVHNTQFLFLKQAIYVVISVFYIIKVLDKFFQ
jgi:hypothetical protein